MKKPAFFIITIAILITILYIIFFKNKINKANTNVYRNNNYNISFYAPKPFAILESGKEIYVFANETVKNQYLTVMNAPNDPLGYTKDPPPQPILDIFVLKDINNQCDLEHVSKVFKNDDNSEIYLSFAPSEVGVYPEFCQQISNNITLIITDTSAGILLNKTQEQSYLDKLENSQFYIIIKTIKKIN